LPGFLPKSSQLITKNDYFELSIYCGKLTQNYILESAKKINNSFPNLPKEFFDVFVERIKENNFCDSRLSDSVNYVIDNCVYPAPTIAQFISFDKKIKLYTYDQMLKLRDLDSKIFEYYRPVDIEGSPIYAHIADIKKYNIKLWNK